MNLPRTLVERDDEIAVTVALMCNRRLFGECYRSLMPEHFETMGLGSGVMIGAFIPSAQIDQGITFPGDIDLLVIPYEDDHLILSATLAIEVKIVRAKYAKQSKAPNEFGFSQAKATLSHGFPFAAVAHLITSDESPEDAWGDVLIAQLVDANTGGLDFLEETKRDLMPTDLISRSFGRLNANCDHDYLGLLAAYVHRGNSANGIWSPSAKAATRSLQTSESTLEAIAQYYRRNFRNFMDTPKY